MGYESRIYVIREFDNISYGLPYGEKIAVLNLCKMGSERYNKKTFRELFNQERTCHFYADDGETIIEEDRYGDKIQKADPKEVIKWLRKMLKNDYYWRAEMLYKFLLGMEKAKEKTGQGYSLYHYGY